MDTIQRQTATGRDPSRIGHDLSVLSREDPQLYEVRCVSTSDFDPKDRFEAWRSTIYDIVDLTPPAPGEEITGTNRQIRGANGAFSTHEGSAHQTILTASASRAGAAECMVISLMVRGSVGLESPEGAGLTASEGTLSAYDAARPMRYHWSEGKELYLALPRAAAIAALGFEPDGLSLPLDRHPLAPFLSNQMQLLDIHAERLTRRELATVLDATSEVALLVLAGIGAATGHSSQPTNGGLYRIARQYIEANFHRTGLTPEVIAHELGCSRASLYRAFALEEATVMGTLREARLQRARKKIEQSVTDNIAAVAYACGFSDPSAFGKLFKARFGAAPRDWRADFS